MGLGVCHMTTNYIIRERFMKNRLNLVEAEVALDLSTNDPNSEDWQLFHIAGW